jgi:hypothetical protein
MCRAALSPQPLYMAAATSVTTSTSSSLVSILSLHRPAMVEKRIRSC